MKFLVILHNMFLPMANKLTSNGTREIHMNSSMKVTLVTTSKWNNLALKQRL
jgi:flagellar motor component MotA